MLQAGDDGGWTRVEVVKESKRWVGNLLGGGFGGIKMEIMGWEKRDTL